MKDIETQHLKIKSSWSKIPRYMIRIWEGLVLGYPFRLEAAKDEEGNESCEDNVDEEGVKGGEGQLCLRLGVVFVIGCFDGWRRLDHDCGAYCE